MNTRGMKVLSALPLVASCFMLGAVSATASPTGGDDGPFQRIASFPVFLNTNEDEETLAEIITSADHGRLLVYTDSATQNVGFVDIADPENPLPGGVVPVSGELGIRPLRDANRI